VCRLFGKKLRVTVAVTSAPGATVTLLCPVRLSDLAVRRLQSGGSGRTPVSTALRSHRWHL